MVGRLLRAKITVIAEPVLHFDEVYLHYTVESDRRLKYPGKGHAAAHLKRETEYEVYVRPKKKEK
jgi:hypothetical protein